MTAFKFDPNAYGEVCSELISDDDLPPLGPGAPRRSLADRLRTLTIEQLFGGSAVRDRSMASCCLSGLWLWFDYLDESHQISQGIASRSGSFWHGIMHRREPDYSNAKYWFRKVGDHPVFDPLAVHATRLLDNSDVLDASDILASDRGWDPFRFVDLCQRHAGTSTPAELLCRQIARLEWQLLFDYCYRQAVEG